VIGGVAISKNKLFQAAASTGSLLPGPDVQDAWPPVE